MIDYSRMKACLWQQQLTIRKQLDEKHEHDYESHWNNQETKKKDGNLNRLSWHQEENISQQDDLDIQSIAIQRTYLRVASPFSPLHGY